MYLREVIVAAAVGLLAACSGAVDPGAAGGAGGSAGSGGSGGTGGVGDFLWSPLQLIDDSANTDTGLQPSLAVSPSGKLGVAYWRKIGDLGSCTVQTPPVPVLKYDVVYASEDDGFKPQKVSTVQLSIINGLALAFDGAGNPTVAFQGGADTATYCGGSDMLSATRGGAAWTQSTIAADAAGYPVYFPSDVQDCMGAGQDYCHSSTVVGPFPSLLYAGGKPFYVFRDVHFGFAQDDERKADVAVNWNGSTDIDGGHGAGYYIQARLDPSGNPVVAYYSPYNDVRPFKSGIYVTAWDGSKYVRHLVLEIAPDDPIPTGSQLGFGVTAGHMAVAYNHDKQLYFSESTDGGATWSKPEVVDNKGDTGRYPALAYDAQGRPSIAYVFCGKYDPSKNTCDPNQDAIRLAVKDGTSWNSSVVLSRGSWSEASSLSLVYDGSGMAAIAFQSGTFDPDSQMGIRQGFLIREVTE